MTETRAPVAGAIFDCTVCGWRYDESAGDAAAGVPPGTRWDALPDDWACPVCDAGKDAFTRAAAAEVTAPPSPDAPAVATPSLVIVGSGLAGYSLAREVRTRSAGTPVTILTADGGEVYIKPMLSNALGRGQAPDDLVQKGGAALAADLDITIRTRTRVVSIDRAARRVNLADGASLAYDRLVLALGADPRVFPVEGADAVGIATVNDLDDYRAWRRRIGGSGRILLIGAGLIGCEFANDLAGAGFTVTVVDPAAWPLARLLPKDLGAMLSDALAAAGVTLRLGCTVARYQPAAAGFTATLNDGTVVAFDHALSAVGLAPRTRLAADAGLEVRAGIIVDPLLRTGDPAIYAIGDCAETKAGPLPFIAPLLAEARALAATLTGDGTPLHLPALPVVVKTPALPLVVCPPKPGAEGGWTVTRGDDGAVAVFLTPHGEAIGFALAGAATNRQQEMAKRMPDLLPPEGGRVVVQDGQSAETWVCDTCGWVYDPRTGDPEGGIKPGTAWSDVPEGWECPVCGAGKDAFTKAS